MKKIVFDNEKYLKEQSKSILERIEKFNNKLYLEFGGKLMYDYHAARILPGFDPNIKLKLLQGLKDKIEIIICIYSGDIERRKVRADFSISYDVDILRMIDEFQDIGLDVAGVVITRFENQTSAKIFKNKLERRNIRVYLHYPIKGYPTDIELIVSEEGYGKNEYIETTKPLIVVTGPGPNSGKLSTCLSQLYHDWKRGIKSGYAKFETFPVWDLPLKHPVNIAYEVATADIGDFNLIDPFHLETYNIPAVNYNRDIEIFPILKRILEKITQQESVYKSPTDMGVNKIKSGIIDLEAIHDTAKQEIIRRYFRYLYEYILGLVSKETIQRIELAMQELNIKPEDRSTVIPARKSAEEAKLKGKGKDGIFCGAAIELHDGTIITGKNSSLMHAASSLILNAIKYLSGIPDKIHLLSPVTIESITGLKKRMLNEKSASLDLDETLIALSISAHTNPSAELAIEKLKELQNCEAHLTHIPTPGDEVGLRRLGINFTFEPQFAVKHFYDI